jgi:lactate dehydrogenase-like 2-hydroxyacid dehydrogenase
MAEFDVICPSVCDRIDAAVLAGGDRVRLLANFGVGIDHIDVAAAKERSVAVTNTPGVLTDATADIAMTLLLMSARRAGEGERELRAGLWDGWRPIHMLGASLKGKTLGLVGFGRIAQATARRARHGFSMNIAYYARREAEAAVAEELGATFYPDLAGLLAASDFVSLHVPGGAETEGLIDSAAIAAMKPGAHLINTARGSVVDHDALAAALRSGLLGGAGLDVYPAEPEVPAELLEIENVVLLPHLGSATVETRTAMGEKAMANVVAWAEGRELPDRVA